MKNIHIGKWKGDRNRKSKQKMRTRMGTREYAAQLERGAAGIDALLRRLTDQFPDPDKRVKERRARAAEVK
ncbi:MAG: hypothetical protein PHU54_09230 [Candidatus Omnitrophica bacterium]|nr:hypothetical protein [Candidatus Omnitrophota bacterium]